MGTDVRIRVVGGLLAVLLLTGCNLDLRSDAEKRQEIAQQQQAEAQRQRDAIAAALEQREA